MINRFCFLHIKVYPWKDGCPECNALDTTSEIGKRLRLIEQKIQELYEDMRKK